MSDIKLFSIDGVVSEIKGSSAGLERDLQTTIERNMEVFFGVSFLATEYKIESGRIDSVGIDENHCPVIFEYKRNSSENVINQGLFYLDWLLSHRDSFKVLVIEKLGMERADLIDWSVPRVICIAGDFNKYDENAINQMGRNISLIRYKIYDNKYLIFEKAAEKVVYQKPQENSDDKSLAKQIKTSNSGNQTFEGSFKSANEKTKTLYNSVVEYIQSLGDDVSVVPTKLYIALKKIQNFGSVLIRHTQNTIILRLKVDPKTIKLENGFTRDITGLGKWGTGNLEVCIKNLEDLEKSKEFIGVAYREN